ncbi:uncharacterized protein TrAtP1_002838 [Trichoderma atroviride]|uniref:uncharacterized protein n=1 Tax=Hypocrea atroviridis TaxID=63577 RepID=UPI0033322CC7|nr:hypothetical protein TrAtP1_002838 [Trichoderma atroviride]
MQLVRPPDKLVDTNGIARTDHPMWPQQDGVYYFEIKIEHEGDGSGRFAIGFCGEHTPLGGPQLGREKVSWGYNGDSGETYQCGVQTPTPFGEVYGEGDVIGCGVNFDKDIAFYTLNGEIIGKYINSPSFPSKDVHSTNDQAK